MSDSEPIEGKHEEGDSQSEDEEEVSHSAVDASSEEEGEVHSARHLLAILKRAHDSTSTTKKEELMSSLLRTLDASSVHGITRVIQAGSSDAPVVDGTRRYKGFKRVSDTMIQTGGFAGKTSTITCKPGETLTQTESGSLCMSGFHYCNNPFDIYAFLSFGFKDVVVYPVRDEAPLDMRDSDGMKTSTSRLYVEPEPLTGTFIDATYGTVTFKEGRLVHMDALVKDPLKPRGLPTEDSRVRVTATYNAKYSVTAIEEVATGERHVHVRDLTKPPSEVDGANFLFLTSPRTSGSGVFSDSFNTPGAQYSFSEYGMVSVIKHRDAEGGYTLYTLNTRDGQVLHVSRRDKEGNPLPIAPGMASSVNWYSNGSLGEVIYLSTRGHHRTGGRPASVTWDEEGTVMNKAHYIHGKHVGICPYLGECLSEYDQEKARKRALTTKSAAQMAADRYISGLVGRRSATAGGCLVTHPPFIMIDEDAGPVMVDEPIMIDGPSCSLEDAGPIMVDGPLQGMCLHPPPPPAHGRKYRVDTTWTPEEEREKHPRPDPATLLLPADMEGAMAIWDAFEKEARAVEGPPPPAPRGARPAADDADDADVESVGEESADDADEESGNDEEEDDADEED